MSSPSPVSRLPSPDRPSDAEVLVKVENVSKIFCRDFKKSLKYGLQDSARDLLSWGRQGTGDRKRQEAGDTSSSSPDACPPSSDSSTSPISHLPSSNLRPLRDGEFYAVKDVSFELRRGESIGLIGHNGAGKTTLLKMLNGLIKPDTGTIEMRGRVGAIIALGAGFNPILSGRENIYVNGSILGLTKIEIEAKIDEIIDFAEIRESIDAPVQSYSSGMVVRLGFAIAVITEPDILLLDEVLAVGDVGFQVKCFNTLSEFKKRGTSFILVSHNMHQIDRYSNTVLYLKQGEIAHCGDRERGIENFLNDMDQCDTGTEFQRTDWAQVHGSGKIAFTGARFRNDAGQVVTFINAGDPVTLEIDYKRNAELGKPPVLDLIMRDREGIVYQGTNVSNCQPFERIAAKGCFQVHLRQVSVNSDYIDFSFAAVDQSTAEVYDWKRNIRLMLSTKSAQIGRVIIRTDWACS